MNSIPWSRYLALFVLAVITALAVAWFFKNFDKVETQRRTAYSALARSDPWLAMERFLKRSGAQVERVRLNDLFERELPLDMTLLSNGLHEILSIERREFLFEWLEQGGQIVAMVPNQSYSDEETVAMGGLLSDLGLYVETSIDEQPEPTVFSFDEEEAEVSVQFNPGFSQQYLSMDGTVEPSGSLGSDGRFQLIQYEFGDGRLTVLNSDKMLDNWHLEDEDHAWFLHQMAGVQRDAKVWVAYHRQWPTLGQWLWQHAAWLLGVLLLSLVLWLWRCSLRMGPLLERNDTERRHLGEHLQASADFLWRYDEDLRLIHASRDRVRQRWLQHHAQLAELSPQDQLQWIARHAGLAQNEQQLFTHQGSYSERDLLRLTQMLQRLLWLPETRPLNP